MLGVRRAQELFEVKSVEDEKLNEDGEDDGDGDEDEDEDEDEEDVIAIGENDISLDE